MSVPAIHHTVMTQAIGGRALALWACHELSRLFRQRLDQQLVMAHQFIMVLRSKVAGPGTVTVPLVVFAHATAGFKPLDQSDQI